MRSLLQRTVSIAGRRPGRVLLVAGLLVALGALLSLRLQPTAATDTFVGRGSAAFAATDRLHRRFGDDAVVILVRGSVKDLVLTADLGRLLGLEGCIAGNAPAGAEVPGGPRGPCAAFARTKPVQVVYGPGTFINSAVTEIQRQLTGQIQAAQRRQRAAAAAARGLAARQGRTPAEQRRAGRDAAGLVQAQFTRDLLQLALRYGLSTRAANPQLDNPDFVYNLVFDPARGATAPKARFAYLFPSGRSAAIQVRLRPGLDDAQRAAAIARIRAATRMPQWRLSKGATYTVTGAPVLLSDVAADLTRSLVGLLVGGLVLMALVLAAVFRGRARMLPLGVALGAAAIVFGALSALGVKLTLASIAVLPVLLGLGVDYAIQYQSRVQEDGVDGAAGGALATIATAGLATVVGFGVLLLSPVPMVRGFGLILMAGIVVAFVLALSAGTAVLVALARRPRASAGRLAASGRGAADLLRAAGRPAARPAAAVGGAANRLGRATTALALRRPVAVLAAGALLAGAGWAVDSRTAVVSDVRELVPRDTPAVRDLQLLQDTTGVAGEVDVLVEGDDLTRPAVIRWMRDYRARVTERYGYSASNGCGKADLCPALSLTDLFRSDASVASQARIRALLGAVPPYFSNGVITRDRRTAVLAFGVKLMPLERQEALLGVMRDELHPPAGVHAALAGLPVLVSQANADLSSPWRRLGTLLAGLLAVALVLLAVYRRWERAWVPLVPIALATGWSALVLWLLGVPLNPMSATLGVLVIAISTEFAVLLTARFREERERGLDVPAALRRTYASTGRAVLASGATAVAGFAVLAFSDVRMLQDFGRVTVVDLTVSLLGVLAVLPAVLTLAERRARRRGRSARRAEDAGDRAPALVG